MRLLVFFHPRTAHDFSEDKRDHTIVYTQGCVLCSSAFFPRRSHCHKGPLRTLSPWQKGPLPGYKNLPRFESHARAGPKEARQRQGFCYTFIPIAPVWYAKHLQKKPKSHLAPSMRNGDGSLTWDRLKPSIRDWVGPCTEVKVQQLDATRDW